MRIDVGGHALEAELTGAGLLSFVCLHGLADDLGIWKKLAPALAQRGRTVVVDQRAHGKSEAPPGPYRREDLAADVRAVLDAFGIERTILVGHSMGGIIAMTTALAVPDRVAGLVLLGTASQCSGPVAEWYERIAVAAESEGLDGLRRAIFGARSERRIAGDAQGLAHVTRCLRSLHDDPLTPKLASVCCPTLLLVGDKDPMGPGASAIIQKAIPGSVLEVVPERGHWLHVEAPESVLEAIDRFLATRFRDGGSAE